MNAVEVDVRFIVDAQNVPRVQPRQVCPGTGHP
jgi:hypothetical protein